MKKKPENQISPVSEQNAGEKEVYRTHRVLGTVIVCAIILAMALIFVFVGEPLIRFVSEPEQFRAWISSYGIWSGLIFIGIMTLQIIVAVIPGEPVEIAAGYAFGAIPGTVLCLISSILGSAVVFLAVRRFGKKLLHLFFDESKIDSLKFLQNEKKLNITVFILFLLPGTPKDIMTYFVGLTKMKLSAWMLISTVARLPSLVTSTIGGDALGMQNYMLAIITFAVTMLISGTGLLIYRKICALREKK